MSDTLEGSETRKLWLRCLVAFFRKSRNVGFILSFHISDLILWQTRRFLAEGEKNKVEPGCSAADAEPEKAIYLGFRLMTDW